MTTDTDHHRTIQAERFDFGIAGEPGHDDARVGLWITETDGTCQHLAVTPDLAQDIGRMLIAHSDYLAQREPREWD